MGQAQKITPFLWFDREAEEAMNFYVSVFNGSPRKNGSSRVVSIARYPKAALKGPGKGMEGKVINGVFELAGERFMALDGGPIFKFNESFSLMLECADQEELDYFWSKLSAQPKAEQCGWLKDKYGLSWQVVPAVLRELMDGTEPERANRVMAAVLKMKKIDIAELRRAYAGR